MTDGRVRPGEAGAGTTEALRCTDTLVVRAAVLPAESRSRECGYASARESAADGDDLGLLRAAADDPLLREAVAVASDSLDRLWDRAVAGEPVRSKQLRRAARAVERYRLRMSGRSTPFGLMAGVAAGTFGPAAKARWGGAHTKSVRPDLEWLTGLVTRLEQKPEVLRSLRVVANDLCVQKGGRLTLDYLPGNKESRGLSLRCTPVVLRALERARQPVSHLDLLVHLAQHFPQAGRAALDRLVGQLVNRRVLVTDLQPPPYLADPIGHLVARLTEVPGRPCVSELLLVQQGLAEYTAAPPGAGRVAWTAVTERMRRLHPADRLVQVDLGLDADVVLPESVREEVERAAQALCTMATGWPGAAHLREYHERFLERYGLGRAVPVGELLDPGLGLGPPAGYAHPKGERPATAFPGEDIAEARQQLLCALAQEAAETGRREVVLDDALVARLSGDGPPALSLDLIAQIRADSEQALDEGDFTLVVTGTAPVAGASMGRFAPLLGQHGDLVGEIVRALPTRAPRALRVQVEFTTPRPGSGNVARVPRWLGRTVAVGMHADPAAPDVLSLAELAVVAHPDRLALWSTRLDREVVATLPHMLATDLHAPNAVRLLDELSRSGESAWPRWRWGAAEALPFLPRVRYGRTVLAPARWMPVEPELRDGRLPYADWVVHFARWRERWQVPDAVQCVTGDHRITLDLNSPRHLVLLHNEWTRHPDSVLQEPPVGNGGWLGPGGRANEVAFPLLREAVIERRQPERAVAPSRTRRLHRPGGPWLYAKLYCSAARQDDILRDRLPVLLARLPDTVDRWFYLRYRDPDPHLRLRFHGEQVWPAAELLPVLHAWTQELADEGLVGDLRLDSYDPEYERYGGPAAMPAAERAFQADAVASLEQLALLRSAGPALAPQVLAAANYLDLARRFDRLDLLSRAFTATDRLVVAAGHREAAKRFLDPAGRWSELAAQPGGPELLAVWERRAAAVREWREQVDPRWSEPDEVLSALLHMHHNRLFGIDRAAEEQGLALARRAVRSHTRQHDAARDSARDTMHDTTEDMS